MQIGGAHLEELIDDVTTIPRNDSILDTIRVRPAMYMGLKSLTGLWFFLNGAEMAKSLHGIKSPPEIPRGFADWVGYRLHLKSNCGGFWHRAILSRIRDEHLAFDRFFELRDEFLRRRPRTIATVRKDRREFQVGRMSADGLIINCTELLPESLNIVVYTGDPGFFLIADEGESFFYNGWFFAALDSSHVPISDRFAVQDQDTWNRLLLENKRFKRSLARARVRRQKQQAQDVGKNLKASR
jgi:hypothetical protein